MREWPINPGISPQCNRWGWLNRAVLPVLWIDATNVRLTRATYSCHQCSISPRKMCYLSGHSLKCHNTCFTRHRSKYIDYFGKKVFFRSLLQTHQLLKQHTHKVKSASGTSIGPIDQCDLTFKLGNKQFNDRFTMLQDLHRNIILGLNWQCNYTIDCNWNINEQQYITHNNKFLCTHTTSSNTEPMVQNSGASCCWQGVYQSFQCKCQLS